MHDGVFFCFSHFLACMMRSGMLIDLDACTFEHYWFFSSLIFFFLLHVMDLVMDDGLLRQDDWNSKLEPELEPEGIRMVT